MCSVQTIYTQLIFLCLRLLPKLFLFCLTILLLLDSFQFIVCALIWLMEVPVGGCCILLLSPDCEDLGTCLVLKYKEVICISDSLSGTSVTVMWKGCILTLPACSSDSCSLFPPQQEKEQVFVFPLSFISNQEESVWVFAGLDGCLRA